MLHYETVSPDLINYLSTLMSIKEFECFRLVGGTALSLQLGHRVSVDIDIFTDAAYGSIDFKTLEQYLKSSFSYVDHFSLNNPAIGMSFSVGRGEENAVKVDVYYTDPFIRPALVVGNIRMATLEEIAAMKIDVVQRGGRKKDFWDIHELLSKLSINEMLDLHAQRYEYGHDRTLILGKLMDFKIAEDDLEPKCLRGKYWEFIKEDIEEAVRGVGGR